LREAGVAKSVRHEHVVAVLDAGEVTFRHNGAACQAPYLLMEWLEGESLSRRLATGALPWHEVLRIGREALLGLAAIHGWELTHRDIKPLNLWLEAPRDRLKVLDFGLARATDHTQLTAAGFLVGTPACMSPEQARGEEANPRSDLFSLGAVLYYACTGDQPFKGTGHAEVLCAVRERTPKLPS
jgi:serine/threonine protein kinase